MHTDTGSYPEMPSSAMQPLPADGIIIFSTPTPPRPDLAAPAPVRIVITSEDIDQTGIAPQVNDLFALQLALTLKGVRLYYQWNASSNGAPLYLAIDGTLISPVSLQSVDEDTIQLAGLDFDSVYALAVNLGYDQESLSALSQIDPRGAQPTLDPQGPVTGWKITSTSGQFIGDQLDVILEILNNRFDACFTGQVSARRVQSSLQAVSPRGIDREMLTRLVTATGQVTLFSSRQRPRKDETLPPDTNTVLTQEHIQFATLEDSGHITLVLELNDLGIETLSQYQAQSFKAPIYLALDEIVAAPQNLIISGDSRLELDDLPETDALFLFAVLDNEPLPTSLSISPAAANLQDEELPITWKVAPNDPNFDNLDDVFLILNNRAGMLYQNDISVERAQSSLRIITAPYIDSSQVLRLVSTLGKSSFISTAETPRIGAAVPSSASIILDQSRFVSASLENRTNPTLVLELDEEGAQQIAAFLNQNPNQPIYLSMDGRYAAETPLAIKNPSRVALTALLPEEALFLCAMLDNDPLPTSLNVSPITLSRADESFMRGFNDLWLVKPLDDLDLPPQEWEDIRSILTYRIETMLKDSTSVEFEGGRLMIIPDLHTDVEDLKSIVTQRGEVLIFTAPFAPTANQPIPQGARQLLNQDQISAVEVEYDEHDTLLNIKLNVEGAHLGRDFFKSRSASQLYIAIDGKVASSQPLISDGGTNLFMEKLSNREANFLAAMLDNDILPLTLTLEPVALDSYNQYLPDPNQIWYVEPADSATDLSHSQIDQVITILKERSANLLDNRVTFETDDDWGILVQFSSDDTPINLDILEQLVSRQGRVSIFTSSTPPVAGEMLAFSAHVHLTEEHILSTEASASPNSAVLKLRLDRQGKSILATLQSKPLFIALDAEVISSVPLSRIYEDELQLGDLEFEKAKLLSALLNHHSLPVPLHLNMEESGG